jgi:hypothetical protein
MYIYNIIIDKKDIEYINNEFKDIVKNINLIKNDLTKSHLSILHIIGEFKNKYKLHDKYKKDLIYCDNLISEYLETSELLYKIMENNEYKLLEKVVRIYAKIQIESINTFANLLKKIIYDKILDPNDTKNLYELLDDFIKNKNNLKKFIDSKLFKNFNNFVKEDNHPGFILSNMLLKYIPYLLQGEEYDILNFIKNTNYN